MKKVLALLKAHGVILVCLIVPVGAIAAGWFFSSGWNASIKENIEQSIQKDTRSLDGLTQNFEIPQLDPKKESLSFSMVPNRATVELAGEKLRSNIRQSERIKALALEFNKEGKALLIDGPNPEDKLFPEPVNNAVRLRKLSEIREVWPRAHAELLEDVQAGTILDAATVIEQLEQFRAQQVAAIVGDRIEQTLNEQEQANVDLRVSERRVELARARAAEIAFYAESAAFLGVHSLKEAATIERVVLPQAWDWQHRYWVHEDIVRALRDANTELSTGFFIPVHRAPVKRLVSLEVEDWTFGEPPEQPPVSASQEIPRDFSISVAGLTSWPEMPNSLYDTRSATLVAHVSSVEIDRVLESLQSRNFVRITAIALAEVNEFAEFTRGYDYGTDHVVEMTISLETVWLRDWTKDTMPPSVRSALGIPEEEPEAEPKEEQAS